MRLVDLKLHGIAWPFEHSTAEIDFAALGPGLIALVGGNGAGKTTLLEGSGPMVFHRRSPYYETPLAKQVTAENAFVNLTFDQAAERWQLRVQSNGSKTEAYLFKLDGETWGPVAGPLLSDVDQKLQALVPDLNLLLLSAFAAQKNRQSFFEISKKERKDAFAKMLGAENLQELSEEAGRQAMVQKGVYEAMGGREVELEAEATRGAELREQITEVGERHATVVARIGELVPQEAEARALVERETEAFGKAQGAYEAAKAAYDEAEETLDAKVTAVSDLTAEIEGAERQMQPLDEATKATEELSAGRILADERREEVREVEERLRELQTGVSDLEREVETHRETVRSLRDRRERLKTHYSALDDVEDITREICQACPLTKLGREALEEWTKLGAEVEEAVKVGKKAKRQLDKAAEVRDQAETLANTRRTLLAETLEGTVELERVAAKLPAAQAAKASLEQLSQRLAKAETELDQARALTIEAPEAPDSALLDGARESLGKLTEALGDYRKEESELAGTLARIEGEITALGDTGAKQAQVVADKAFAEQEASDWSLLARALGRDGIQALLIDAAGPEVQEIANALLRDAYGPRFQIRLVTTQPLKKGGTKEVFDIEILDAEARRTGTKVSGGEQAVIDEAVRLALSIYNTRRSGIAMETAWRDETSGPLDPKNAVAYVRMLKAARDMGGFHQILLICHSEEVWRQADVRLFVANGQVEVEREAA